MFNLVLWYLLVLCINEETVLKISICAGKCGNLFHWESTFTGMSAYHSYFSRWSEPLYLSNYRSTVEFLISDSNNSFLVGAFPILKRVITGLIFVIQVFMRRGLSEHYIHQMALCVQNHTNVLPDDISADFPGYACLLGNILETASVFFSQPDCSLDMAIDIAAVMTFLLQALPPMKSSNRESKENSSGGEDEMAVGDEIMEKVVSRDLEQQISNAIDPRFLLQLTNALFGGISLINHLCEEGPDDREVAAIGAACAFLHVTFNILPLERIMTVLAYRTELVPLLWKFIKRCHENQKWSSLSEQLAYLSGDMPGWQLPLAVFCPVYKHMLTIVDNEEFYEQEKPLSLSDIRCLIVILRQVISCLLLGPPFEAKLEWGFGRICLWVVLQHGRSSACQKGKVDSLKEYWLAWVDNLVEKGGKGANMGGKRVWASGVSSEGVVFWMVWMVCDYYEDVEGSYFSLLCWKEINQTFRGMVHVALTLAVGVIPVGILVTHLLFLQALWQLLWVNPAMPPNLMKPAPEVTSHRGHPIEFTQQRVSIVTAELLSQLQDWNNRRQFAPPSYFHADAVNEYFISQAVIENTRAYTILKQAPFLVPFTSRVKIFTSQLAAARQRDGSHSVFTRNRFRIRRDHILEDAFNQLSVLSEDDLRGLIRISFVNEFGVEEAGIDGGGIFKDFMENITRAAFDVQYGLFKETADHLLYPNPGSGMIHEQHLQFFHFLGTVLGKV
ncbi:E3 ubiquitin-protein ligase UPL6 [Vitis vinifera]|uniref:HECT-type E3 ubiquitin transferase n=1 Tax=Vitis vinifera TaxID=29760 RepID=A0A438CTF6_VITVI|nr:E3 ubiquitin-protein ligase UPL6 [Vitis vinifera]